MSIKAMNWMSGVAFESSGAKYVLLALADRATDHDGEDWTCFPAVGRIVEYTSQKERTVHRHIDWLIAQCWISKIERPTRGRDEARFFYVLHRDRTGYGPMTDDQLAVLRAELDAKLAGGRGVDKLCKTAPSPAKLASGKPSTTCQIGNDHLPNWQRPPAKLAKPPIPPYKDKPSLNPHLTSASERANAFELALTAYPKTGAVVTDEAAARAAWISACDEVSEAVLLGCVRAYAADPMLRRRDYGAPSFQRFLNERRWRRWLGEANGVRDGDAQAVRFDGPPELRAAVVAQHGEAAAKSYLDPATWRDADRTILCATRTAVDWLRRAGCGLGGLGVRVEWRAAGAKQSAELIVGGE